MIADIFTRRERFNIRIASMRATSDAAGDLLPHPAVDPAFSPKPDSIWGATRRGLDDPEGVLQAQVIGAALFGVELDSLRLAFRIGVGRSPMAAACAEFGYMAALAARGKCWRLPVPLGL